MVRSLIGQQRGQYNPARCVDRMRCFAAKSTLCKSTCLITQLEKEERVEKLEGTVDSVQEAYVTLLEKVERYEGERETGVPR